MARTGNELKLFEVQDDDRPLYVLAADMNDALVIWRDVIQRENNLGECMECEWPRGIRFVAGPDDIAAQPIEREAR